MRSPYNCPPVMRHVVIPSLCFTSFIKNNDITTMEPTQSRSTMIDEIKIGGISLVSRYSKDNEFQLLVNSYAWIADSHSMVESMTIDGSIENKVTWTVIVHEWVSDKQARLIFDRLQSFMRYDIGSLITLSVEAGSGRMIWSHDVEPFE
jgi:hypothetical protein